MRGKHARSSPLLVEKAPAWRSRFVMATLAVGFLGLIGRAIYVQALNAEFFEDKVGHLMKTEDLPASRGRIYDRNGHILASSIVTISVGVRPRHVLEADTPKRVELARLLGMSLADLNKRMDDTQKKFVWLKQYMEDESVGPAVKALNMAGLDVQRQFFRKYPEGESAAHVVGLVGAGTSGLEGVERLFEKELTGRPGSRRVIQDQIGNAVDRIGEDIAPVDGKDIYLSIDARLQDFAYRKLRDAVSRHKARAGSVVVLDARTGEVLVLANYPSYDPEEWKDREKWRKGGQQRFRNMALSDAFEPGSTMKPITVAMAIETGQVKPDTLINTSPGRYQLDKFTVKDARNYGTLTVQGVLQKSSNVGVLKISQRLPAEYMWETYTALGYGQRPEIGLKDVALGRLRPWKHWRPTEKASMSYGYGLSASLIQMARSYTAFANDGQVARLRLRRVDRDHPLAPGVPVFSAATAETMRKMLQTAVGPGSTGQAAQTEHYSVGGKSGTARKLVVVRDYYGKGRHLSHYDNDRHRAWFIGLGPISAPRLVTVVMVDEPTVGGYYGGLVAAPVFREVMEHSLRTLGVQSDLKAKPQIVTDIVEESF